MLATIRKPIQFPFFKLALLLCVVAGMAACVTKKPEPLIRDPSAQNDSALPWNEQQKWEREGEAAVLNQQRR